MRDFPTRQLVSIVVTLGLLIAVIVMQRNCGQAVNNLFQAVAPVDGGHD